MDAIPKNHRLAERVLIQMVTMGKWRIDQDGRVWNRDGRRAEKQLSTGYLMVRVMFSGKRHCGLAHRLVWQHLHGDIPAGYLINHRNGLKDDNRPANLECRSISDNAKHAHQHGLRDQHGQRNPNCKLTDHDVAQMRLAYSRGGFTQAELATSFKVSHQQVARIVRGSRRTKQGGPIQSGDQRSKGRMLPRDLRAAAGVSR